MLDKTPGIIYEGKLDAKGMKFAVVCGRFNSFFVDRLLEGAMDAIVRHGGSAEDVSVAYVPGSYEIPFAIKKLLSKGGILSPTPCAFNTLIFHRLNSDKSFRRFVRIITNN